MKKIFIAMCILGMGSSYAKAGHTLELRFEGLSDTIPPTSFVKLKEIGVDKEKIIESTYKEGSRIPLRQSLVFKIDDHTNENYISREKLSDFRNEELLQEDYNKLFHYISFEVDGKPLTFEWTQQSPSCLYWRSVYEGFRWDVLEKGVRIVNKKTGFYHHVMEIRLRKIGDSI